MSDNESKQERLIPLTYTIEQLADILQCSIRHVYRLHSRRAIPGAVQCGHLLRWSRKIVDAWIAERHESAEEREVASV